PLSDRVPTGDLRDLAERLGLPQVADLLGSRYDRLAIVPDDALVNVPFAALPLGDEPLVARYTPYFVPRWRWTARSCRPAYRYRSGLGVAVSRSEREPELRELEQARPEVTRIQEAAGGQLAILPEPCTRTQVVQHLETADYVHFACHGHFDPALPFQSGLLLSDDWLTLPELLAAPCPRLDRVVLAACWTANATVLPGREMIGLPMTFLRMGARAVISSIWDVYDPSSPEFMHELYRMFEEAEPFVALAKA